MVEQAEAKRHTGGLQALAKLGHNAGGVEPALDAATGPSPSFSKDRCLDADDVSLVPVISLM